MQFSLRWLLLLITAICLALAWCSHFQLEPKHFLPTSLVGIAGIACSVSSVFLQRDLRLGLSVTGAILLIIDAVVVLESIYDCNPWCSSHTFFVTEMLQTSAAIVVTPALALFPVASSVFCDSVCRSARPLLVSLGLAWILLLLHLVLLNWVTVYMFQAD